MSTERESLESLAHQRLRNNIEGIVELRVSAKFRGKAVVDKLSLKTPLEGLGDQAASIGLEVLSGGFGSGITSSERMSFLAYCLKHDADEVLRAVLKSKLAPQHELLELVCRWRHAQPLAKGETIRRVEEKFSDFWTTVIEENSGIGVGLALEFVGDAPKLVGPHDYSAHALALHKACVSLSLAGHWAFKVNLPICRILIGAKAPILVDGQDNFLMDKLSTLSPAEGLDEQYGQLVSLYRGAGLLDPSKRLTGGALGFAGKLPLTAAILLHNKTAALELVRMGADTSLVGDDADMPGMGALDVLKATPAPKRMTSEQKDAFVAEFTEECMRAALARSRSAAPTAGDAKQRSAGRRRLGL